MRCEPCPAPAGRPCPAEATGHARFCALAAAGDAAYIALLRGDPPPAPAPPPKAAKPRLSIDELAALRRKAGAG